MPISQKNYIQKVFSTELKVGGNTFWTSVKSGCSLLFFGMMILLVLCQISWAAVPDNYESDSLLDLNLRVFVAGKPINLILVEKDKQRLRLLRHDGRLRVMAEYEVATGENEGPKQIEGDAKTPEGIYFITKIYTDSKISIFGKRAFHLDYPNIFDKESGKGGRGIFVHGTNKVLVSRSTNGCITLNNGDLDRLAKYLPVGTVPVVVVSSLSDLVTKDVGDNGVGAFVGNGFELAKKLMVPEGGDLARTFFDNLYMIRTNNQTVAVGQYRYYLKPGEVESGFVRSYLDYSVEEGWVVSQSYNDSLEPETETPFVASLSGKINSPEAPEEEEIFTDLEELAEFNFVSPKKNQERYLAWYKEYFIDPPPAEVVEVEKVVEVVVEPEPKSSKNGLISLFFLTIIVSVGSVWLFTLTKFKNFENEENSQESKENIKAAIARINEDVVWVKDTIGQLEEKNSQKAPKKEFLEVQDKLAGLEKELAEKETLLVKIEAENVEIRNAEEAIKAENLLEKESLAGTIASLEERLEEERSNSSEFEEIKVRFVELEQELESKDSAIKNLAEERSKLILQAEQGEYKAELEEVKNAMATVEKELAESENKLKAQTKMLADLSGIEKDLSSQKAEVEKLSALNDELSEIAKQGEVEKGELERVKTLLAGLETKLSESESKCASQASELADYSMLKEELSQKEEELVSLQASNAEELAKISQQRELEKGELAQLKELFEGLELKLSETESKVESQVLELASFEKIKEELSQKEEELVSMQLSNAEELAKISQQREQEKEESEQLKETVASLDSKLSDMEKVVESQNLDLAEFTNIKEDMAAKETEIERKDEEIEKLQKLNSELADVAEQTEYKEELARVTSHLSDVEAELQEAAQHRERLAEQVVRLMSNEETITAYQQELDKLKAENVSLQERAEQSEYQGELEGVNSQLIAMEAELQKATAHREKLERQIEMLSQPEPEPEPELVEVEPMIEPEPLVDPEPVVEQSVIIEKFREEELQDQVVEEKQPEPQVAAATIKPNTTRSRVGVAPGQNYMPDDILQKWISG